MCRHNEVFRFIIRFDSFATFQIHQYKNLGQILFYFKSQFTTKIN